MNVTLRILALLHFIIGITFGLWASMQVSQTGSFTAVSIFIGIVCSQAGLLRIWLALGRHPFWVGIITVVGAAAYLIFNLGYCINEPGWPVAVFLIAIVIMTFIPLRAFRCAGYEAQYWADLDEPASGVRFTIRDLMIGTLLVGVVLAGARWCQMAGIDMDVPLVFPIPFAVASIVTVWALIGWEHPIIGSVGVTVGVVGTLGGMGHYLDPDLPSWTIAAFAAAFVLVVSLAVIRSLGIRIVCNSASML